MFIDTHCHISKEYFDDIPNLIDNIVKSGVNKVIVNGCDMKSNFEVKINKEIRDYTESILLGLSLRQSIFSILACGSACIIYFLCSDSLGQEITSWICMLAVIPFACFGSSTCSQIATL